MVERKRPPTSITLDPAWKVKATKLAEARGVTLSRYLEILVREDFAREQDKRAERRART